MGGEIASLRSQWQSFRVFTRWSFHALKDILSLLDLWSKSWSLLINLMRCPSDYLTVRKKTAANGETGFWCFLLCSGPGVTRPTFVLDRLAYPAPRRRPGFLPRGTSNARGGQPLTTDILEFGVKSEDKKMRSCSNAIYGSRIKGNYPSRASGRTVAWRRFIPIGDGSNRRTLVYDRDVVKAALLAAEHPKAAGRLYNVSDRPFHTLNEIIITICQALGRKPPRFSVPVGPARFMAGLMEDTLRLVGRKSPIGRDTIDKYTEDIAVSSQRIQTELGFKPQYDLQTGWQERVQEMRKTGLLWMEIRILNFGVNFSASFFIPR